MKISPSFIALFVKLGPKLVSLIPGVLKTSKATKVGLAGASAAAYSSLFTWEFAVAIMTMLFIHESGHVWAMKKCGIPTKGFYFIPLIGGAAVPERQFHSRAEEFYVAIMGPIWGLGLTVVTAILWYFTNNPLLAALTSWMALINLINLLPVNPLDGGRMLKSIVFSINNRIGFLVLTAMLGMAFLSFYFVDNFGLVTLLLFVAIIEFLSERSRIFPVSWYLTNNNFQTRGEAIQWLRLRSKYMVHANIMNDHILVWSHEKDGYIKLGFREFYDKIFEIGQSFRQEVNGQYENDAAYRFLNEAITLTGKDYETFVKNISNIEYIYEFPLQYILDVIYGDECWNIEYKENALRFSIAPVHYQSDEIFTKNGKDIKKYWLFHKITGIRGLCIEHHLPGMSKNNTIASALAYGAVVALLAFFMWLPDGPEAKLAMELLTG